MRRCPDCEVEWRGLHQSVCWSCGKPGVHTWGAVIKDRAAPFEASDRAVRGEGIEPPTSPV